MQNLEISFDQTFHVNSDNRCNISLFIYFGHTVLALLQDLPGAVASTPIDVIKNTTDESEEPSRSHKSVAAYLQELCRLFDQGED